LFWSWLKKEYSLLFLLEYAGGLRRCLVNLTGGVAVGEFGVKESVSDMFLLFSIYRLILVGIDRGDSKLWQISLISFFRDLTIL